MISAKSITLTEFKDALSRYPELIKKISDNSKPAPLSLEELDKFRYIDAPASFSKKTGRAFAPEDVQKLTAWKLRHGTFRPSLAKLVASNTEEIISTTTKEAFAHYSSNPKDVSGTLKLLSGPLKGIGPATASLLLSIHDPDNIIFFSDEAYRWLVVDGKKVSLRYDVKEFDALNKATQDLISRLHVSPIQVEQATFVIIKEEDAVKAAPKAPSGKPRGRPPLPESEKKKPTTVPGRGRGRPPGKAVKAAKSGDDENEASAASSGNKRGRPRNVKEDSKETTDASKGEKKKKRGPPKEAIAPSTTGKKRGRPAGVKSADEPKSKKSKA